MSSSRHLRVTAVINGLGTGGAERSLVEMLPILRQQHQVEVEVVCLFERVEGVATLLRGQTNVTRLTASSWIGRIMQLRRILRKRPPDLVHTTIFEADLVGRFAAAGTGIPVLSSVVNVSYDEARAADPRVKAWKLDIARMIDGWSARHLTNRIHVLTESVGQSAHQELGIPRDMITVVGRGRQLERLGEASAERAQRVRRALGFDDGRKVLVAVGRHEFQKGHRYLIEAMPAIRAELPEAVLLIVGRAGSVSNELSAAIERLGLGQSVHLLGHRQDVGDLLVAADVFIFPSLFEGFGGAMIEAMALGVPVVASDIPPLREVAGDGSVLFVPPASTEALAGGVIRILQDHGLAERLVGEARAVFQSRYTLAAVVNQMAQLYRQVAARL